MAKLQGFPVTNITGDSAGSVATIAADRGIGRAVASDSSPRHNAKPFIPIFLSRINLGIPAGQHDGGGSRSRALENHFAAQLHRNYYAVDQQNQQRL